MNLGYGTKKHLPLDQRFWRKFPLGGEIVTVRTKHKISKMVQNLRMQKMGRPVFRQGFAIMTTEETSTEIIEIMGNGVKPKRKKKKTIPSF